MSCAVAEEGSEAYGEAAVERDASAAKDGIGATSSALRVLFWSDLDGDTADELLAEIE